MSSPQKSQPFEIDPPLPANLDAERSILGAILLDNAALAKVRALIIPEDFSLANHVHLLHHMITLYDAGSVVDLVTLTEKLHRESELDLVGGAPYVASLVDGLPRVSHVEHYCRIVKSNGLWRNAIHAAEAIKQAAFDREDLAEIQKRFTATAEHLQPANGAIPTFTARELCKMKVPAREFLLHPLITTRSMGQLFSWRGTGKTFVALAMAHAVATGGAFLRFRAPQPNQVLYVDGELDADELQKRARALNADQDDYLEFLCVDMLDDPFPHLATARAQHIIEQKLDGKKLLVLDNLSALGPSTNETESAEWVSIQSWLLHLRKNGIASMFLHHAGHSGGSRGTTRREDLLDWVAKLEHPKDYNMDEGIRFEMRFTKTRAFMADAAHPIEAKLTTLAGESVWTYRDIEDARLGQILELRAVGTSWREIETLTSIPRSTAERLWRQSTQSKTKEKAL